MDAAVSGEVSECNMEPFPLPVHNSSLHLASFVFQISRKFVFGYSSQIPEAILLSLELLFSCTAQRRMKEKDREAIGHHFSCTLPLPSHHSI